VALQINTLPLDAGVDMESVPIPADIENPSGDVMGEGPYADHQSLVGLLPDTSRYYGVVWNRGAFLGLMYGEELVLTTFDKKLKYINTTNLTASNTVLDPGGGRLHRGRGRRRAERCGHGQ